MPRPKKKPEETPESPKKRTYKFGKDLPKRIEVKTLNSKYLEDYKYKVLGRYWAGGKEIICLMLTECSS